MGKKFYITTPIYYINAEPHIGHAYTTVIADIFARWHRLKGEDVFFLTGLDENSVKTVQAAKAHGFSDPQAYADWMAEKWISVWKTLNISYDDFIRTTQERHKQNVRALFTRLRERGELYKGTYRGLYCEGCEAYLSEEELVDGKCPLHKTPPRKVEEENFFFRLSKYQDALLEHIKKNPDFIQPESRRNEIVSFIQQGLKDVSITRHGAQWGIEVPGEPDQRIWVWFDALINYLLPRDYWPADIHLIAKDILRFHCVIWPAMLMAAGYELPKCIFAHGFMTVNGQKISKSLGNTINPVYLAQKYSTDVLRYFFAREISFGQDGDFSEENLCKRLNDELADILGNFVHRVLTFIKNYFDGRVPEGEVDEEFWSQVVSKIDKIDELMERVAITQAVMEILMLAKIGNEYFQKHSPWETVKSDQKRAAMCLYNAVNLVKSLCILITPFMPSTGKELANQLNYEVTSLDQARQPDLKPGHAIGQPKPLFSKVKAVKKENSRISLEEFKKLDLRVARVVSAERISGTTRLLKLEIDLGDESRTLVAGIGDQYSPEDLVGKNIVVVANLKPAKIRGVVSDGMLLAAEDEKGKIAVLVSDKEVKPGSKVK